LPESPPLTSFEPGFRPEGFWIRPVYWERGYREAAPSVGIGTAIVPRLAQAAAALRAQNTNLLVLDGWRPLVLQARLWSEYRDRMARETKLEGEALDERLKQFVAPVSQDHRPAHFTGRAVDVTLCDENGDPLAMGGEFDELTERSHPDYYERDGLSAPERVCRDRRRLLHRAMSDAGFVRLPTEWWHFEYGTELWRTSPSRRK
jgi:zinc D-Ala-D-Ala dipeptidase